MWWWLNLVTSWLFLPSYVPCPWFSVVFPVALTALTSWCNVRGLCFELFSLLAEGLRCKKCVKICGKSVGNLSNNVRIMLQLFGACLGHPSLAFLWLPCRTCLVWREENFYRMMSEARSHKNRSLFVVTYTTLQPARAVLLPVMTIGDESLRGLQSKSLPEKAARKTLPH